MKKVKLSWNNQFAFYVIIYYATIIVVFLGVKPEEEKWVHFC